MAEPVQIGSRRELLVDDALIERAEGAELTLHSPARREIAFEADRPWEGNMCGFVTVFRDGGTLRMYYKGWSVSLDGSKGDDGGGLIEDHDMLVCCAESRDGLRWERPSLGLVEFNGSKDNNIVWRGVGAEQKASHGFAPFKDTNPDCPAEQRYKAVGGERHATRGDLWAAVSPDGVRWSLLQEEPIFKRGVHGAFDSQNLAFWDEERGEYRIYFRAYIREGDKPKRRGIKTATSRDFASWSEPEWLVYPGAPEEQLYTNQVMAYPRAPHLFIGFPTRYVQRTWSPAVEAMAEAGHRRLRSEVSERFGAALTDGLFMSSRDGKTFKRWGEAFIRPGPQLEGNWAYGDNYQSWGLFETPSSVQGAPPEYSFLATEGYWRGKSTSFRRFSIRKDGFVSMRAPLVGGEFVTTPLVFEGKQLEVNFSTSAAGSVLVELQDGQGKAIPGFALADSVESVGDELDRTVRWKSGPDASAWAGRPVRLRFVLRDADLYSFRFK